MPLEEDVALVTHRAQAVENWAVTYLQQLRMLHPQRPMAVVVDIDDTLIPSTVQRHPGDVTHAAGRDLPMLEPMRSVVQWATQLGYVVIYITARPDTPGNAELTAAQLIQRGLPAPSRLFLMPLGHLQAPNFSWYKHQVRVQVSRSYDVVLNAGDQWSDLCLLPPFADADARNAHLVKTFSVAAATATAAGATASWPPRLGPASYVVFYPHRDPGWVAIKLPHVN